MSEERQSLVEAVGRLLTVPELQETAVATLTKIGGAEADTQLKEFVELPLSAARNTADELRIRRKAIDALATFRDPDAIDALNALVTSQRLRPELKATVVSALSSDPLIQAESFLANRQYEAAIAPARAVIDASPNTDRMSRARQVLSRVYTIEGQDAFDHSRFSDAKALLLAAVDEMDPAVPVVNRSDLQSLGLNLEFEYHERTALTEPAAYEEAYEILAKLRPLNGDPAFTIAVQAGLAEASLTSGRYADALGLANHLVGRSDVDRVTQLSMKFIVYAALVLDHQPANAARQDLLAFYRTLPKGFKNDWSWAGTRSYIQHAGITDSEKAQLLDTLGKVGT
jgi:tetratricopeptide (TPR) repeat protein